MRQRQVPRQQVMKYNLDAKKGTLPPKYQIKESWRVFAAQHQILQEFSNTSAKRKFLIKMAGHYILGVVNRAQHVRTSLGILGNTERITQIMSVVWKLSTMLCKTSSDIGKRKTFPIWQRSDSNVADVNGWKTIITPTKIALAVAKEGLK